MNQLIKITINEQGSSIVSARDLYECLGFDKSQWARWAKKNIDKNTFAVEAQDWVGFDTMSNGNVSRDYALTVDFAERLCMLARTEKGEEVRRWFQAIKNKALEPALPATQDEIILMLAQRNVETAKRLSVVESRLDRVEAIQSEAQADLLTLPQPSEAMPDLTTADRIRRMVNSYASAKLQPAQEVWRMLYQEMYYRYKVGVNQLKPNPGESKLQMLVRAGHIDKLNTVALHTLRV